jgi:hypothetical protein
VKLCRYASAHRIKNENSILSKTLRMFACNNRLLITVGRCELNPVDPKLESDWFQTLSYEVKTWFQNVPFKCNLHRYITGTPLQNNLHELWVGAVQVESSSVYPHSLKAPGFIQPFEPMK